MKNYTRVCARINLDAVEYNIEMMKKNLSSSAKMIVVIKTDGYGHGAVPIAKMLEEKEYVWGFAVATLDEAVILRTAGITRPVLVLGCIFPDQRREMIAQEIRMTVYTEEMAKEVSDLACESLYPCETGHRNVKNRISDRRGKCSCNRRNQQTSGIDTRRYVYAFCQSG